jgi:hypothetical protein
MDNDKQHASLDEEWAREQVAAPVIEWVRYLGITREGLVRVQLGYMDGHDETRELRADDLTDMERTTGALLTPGAETGLREGVLVEVPRKLFRTFRADTLARLEFPEVQWVIPNTLPEGLAVFAGKPKVGKSWWAMGQAVEVAQGGAVLYLALEDPPRRLQSRMNLVLNGRPAPRSLEFHTDWPRLNDGGLERLAAWLDEHPQTARMVVIDTIAKIRPDRAGNEDQYLGDYGVWGGLQALTIHHAGVAIVGIHHQRKGAAEDVLDTVLGSQGVTGVADTILVLKKSRGQADGELYVTGRDVNERERALKFDSGTWTDVGDAAAYRVSQERDELLDLLTAEGPMKIADVARSLGVKYNTALARLRRAVKAEQVRKMEHGKYESCTSRESYESHESSASRDSVTHPTTPQFTGATPMDVDVKWLLERPRRDGGCCDFDDPPLPGTPHAPLWEVRWCMTVEQRIAEMKEEKNNGAVEPDGKYE